MAFETLAALGGAANVAGQVMNAQAAKKTADYNASVMEAQAAEVRANTAEQERRFRIGTQKQQGSAVAAAGASGVTLDSFADSLAESAGNAELDALTMRWQGERQANALDNSAQLERASGRTKRKAGLLGAAGTAFSTAGGMAGKMG